jgi:hypothetical protein
MRRKTLLRVAAPLLALTLVAGACGDDDTENAGATQDAGSDTTAAPAAETVSTETGAATLRAGLTDLLGEHVYLAALATGAALRGDNAGFEAYATALNGPSDSNSADLVAAVTSAYGAETGKAFDGLWRSEDHIPAFVAYTQAAAKDDQAGKDAAVKRLTSYAKTFGETMNKVNENLPADVVTDAITSHATTLLKVIDAQKAGDQPTVYQSLRGAYHHMDMTAAALAGATAKKFPEKFDGDAAASGAELRAGLHSLLREHVLLAASATGGALGGRMPQFEAAAAALNGPTNSNSADIVSAVGGVYGAEVGKAFDGLWRSEDHIPGFVAYTQAVAKNDQAGKDAAVKRLTSYAKTFGTTMNSVNSNLPADVVEKAITGHATTLIAVIDAQKAGDPKQVASLLRDAVHHMSGTADALASATAKQFPDKF